MDNKSYIIKIPVYTTKVLKKPHDIFGGYSYFEMITFLKKKLDIFKKNKSFISYANRNKTKKTVIDNIDVSEHSFGKRPYLLLQISAHNTNFYDGFHQSGKEITIKKNDKIGSHNNFIMIYPVINGLYSDCYNCFYLVLIYEDPNKVNEEISKITNNVFKEILDIPIKNIKLPDILEELKSIGDIPELQMKYTSISYTDDVNARYKKYLISAKLKNNREDKFKHMPIEDFIELLDEPMNGNYQKKSASLLFGKKEYRIKKELIDEASRATKDTAEKLFNYTTEISQKELENIYNKKFIISKFIPVLENYLNVNTND